jgi:peptidoglycan biosynthesis protein MviN/MurJ (putative lipid II flippase)
MNKFFINFLIQGWSKFLGFIKKDKIIKSLGTTSWGDIYKISYNWPNLFKRILIDGTLDFVIMPYILEGNHQSPQEFQRRNAQLINTFIVILAVLMAIFFGVSSFFSYEPTINYYFRLFFFLIIPMTFNVIFNQILQAKQHFTYTSWGQIINNIIFLLVLFFSEKNLWDIWKCLMAGYLFHNGFLLFFIIKKKYIPMAFGFLPKNIIVDGCKTALFQLCNRLNIFVINFLGFRLAVPGMLIALDYIDNIVFSIIGLFTMTIIIIGTPNFYSYFVEKKEHFFKFTKEIIEALFIGSAIISMVLFINSSHIVKILIGNKTSINQDLLATILRWSSPQIIIFSLNKILQRILTLQKQLNKTLIIALGSSLVSIVIEIFLFKKYHIYSVLLAEYCFIILELITMVYFLNKCDQWNKLWSDGVPWVETTVKFTAVIGVGKFLNIFINDSYFFVKFLLLNGLWGLIILVVFWKQLNILLKKPI